MATITPTQEFPIYGNNNILLVSWLGLANGDEGEPFTLGQYADRSIHILGTFGAGGTVELHGSNNRSDYALLSDNQGDNLSFLTGALSQILEITLDVKPVVTAGDGTTAINAYLLVKR